MARLYLKQFTRLGIIARQRLFTEQMLTRLDYFFVDLQMKMIRRTVVYYVYVRVSQQLLHRGIAFGNTVHPGLFGGQLGICVGNRLKSATGNASHGIDVAFTYVTHPYDTHSELFHWFSPVMIL